MSKIVVKLAVLLLALLCAPDLCRGQWDQAELDLFDLVEEVGENFYDILHVDQSASASEIKRSFRQLSLQLHPDKSDDPDATEIFRKVVAVAEVLKDPQLRQRYDEILVEGLPDWRQPVFYYRRVRKMGLLELTALLLVIGSVGQYLFGLAVYVEKKLVMQDVLSRKRNKSVKKSKTAKASASSQRLEAELSFLNEQATASIPAIHNLLPFWLAKKAFALAKYAWVIYCQWRHSTSTPSNAKNDSTSEEEPSQRKESVANTNKRMERGMNGGMDRSKGGGESDEGSSKDGKDGASDGVDEDGSGKLRRRRGKWVPEELRASARQEYSKPYVPPAYYGDDDEELDSESDEEEALTSKVDEPSECQDTSDSMEDSCKVDKANCEQSTDRTKEGNRRKCEHVDHVVTVGTSSDRHPDETAMPLRSNLEEDTNTSNASNGSGVLFVRNPKDATSSSLWSCYQQKQLEWALVQYPKFAKDRWEKIAKAVPGKSKEECIERFKELCSIVKTRKETKNGVREQ